MDILNWHKSLNIARGMIFLYSLLCGNILHAQITVPSSSNLTVPAGGTIGLGCAALNVMGGFILNSGQVNKAGAVGIGAGGTLDAGSGTLVISGDWSNNGSFIPGSSLVIFNDDCAFGPISFSGNSVFYNLTLISTSGRTFVLPEGSHVTVNGTLTLQGTTGNNIQLVSSGPGAAVVSLGPNANVISNYATVNGNVQIGLKSSTASVPTMNEWGLMMLAAATVLTVFTRRRFKC